MPLTDARRLTEKTAYFPGITNTGWHEEVLIDPGIDEAAYIASSATTVVVTHGHADHFSTAAAIRRAGARVVAPREEATLIENPEVNIRGMFSWAKPSDEMVTKLFRGEGCPVSGSTITSEVAHHRDRLDAISAALLAILRVPHTTEEAIAALCEHLRIVQNPAQYWLAVTTVKGFLSELLQHGLAEFFVDAHRGCWRAV